MEQLQTRLCSSRTFDIDTQRELYKIFIQELPRSIPQKGLIQTPIQSICKILLQGPQEDFKRISTRSSVKDLYRITQGSHREECKRISTRSSHNGLCNAPFVRACADEYARMYKENAGAQNLAASTSHKNNATREITRKLPRPRNATTTLCEPAQSTWTWTSDKSHSARKLTGMPLTERDNHFVRARAVEMHMDISQAPCYERIYRKNAGSPEDDNHFARAIFCRNLQEKCCTPRLVERLAPQTLRAVEMHMEISQEHCYARIYRI